MANFNVGDSVFLNQMGVDYHIECLGAEHFYSWACEQNSGHTEIKKSMPWSLQVLTANKLRLKMLVVRDRSLDCLVTILDNDQWGHLQGGEYNGKPVKTWVIQSAHLELNNCGNSISLCELNRGF